MTNDEIRMTKEAKRTNDELPLDRRLGFRASSFFRHSCFDIRHCP
jgi:hypothetical protein